MKVLFFTYDFPYPTNSGGKMRSYNLLKYAGTGAEIYLFSFVRDGFQKKHIEELKAIGVKHVEVFPRRKLRSIRNISTLFSGTSIFKTLYYDRGIARKLKELIERENISILHFESFYTSFYISNAFPKHVKQIYGSENIEHKLYDEYVSFNVPALAKPFFLPQVKRIEKEEITASRNADRTLAVTESEREYFEEVSGKKASVIENGVSLHEFSYKERKHKKDITILFVGNFTYFPNKDAVMFFYTNVLQKIDASRVTFTVIGKGAAQFEALKDPAIKTIEFIDEIKDAYYNADIFISPVKIGGGTNFKILEAMATGVPVVTFTPRVRDIGAVNGRDVLTGDTPEEFRDQVQRLIDEPELRARLAKNARKIIEEKFSWDTIGKNLHAVWSNLDEKH
jgi:polysaccharide biosynthesis protein PslH